MELQLLSADPDPEFARLCVPDEAYRWTDAHKWLMAAQEARDQAALEAVKDDKKEWRRLRREQALRSSRYPVWTDYHALALCAQLYEEDPVERRLSEWWFAQLRWDSDIRERWEDHAAVKRRYTGFNDHYEMPDGAPPELEGIAILLLITEALMGEW